MANKKSKGERLGWKLVTEIKSTNCEKKLFGIEGKILTQEELDERRKPHSDNTPFMVP